MSSYFMDIICGGQHFLGMNWEWKQSLPPVYVYFIDLWDTRYKYDYTRICNNFLVQLQAILTCEPMPCMSQDVIDVVSKMGDLYVSSSCVYICIFGSTKDPHKLPHYIPYHIIFIKVVYQTYVSRFAAEMIRKKKIIQLKLPLQVEAYKVENVKYMVTKA